MKSKKLIKKTNVFVGVKILNFSYIVLIQIFPALICAYIFDKIFYDRTEEEYKTVATFQLFIELWLQLWFILVLYYIFRNIIVHVPSPFNNLCNSGFKNKLVKETKNGSAFTIVFILCNRSLRSKIRVYKERLFC